MRETFFAHRERIMWHLGKHYMPDNADADARRKEIKKLLNSLEMGGRYEDWKRKAGIPNEITPGPAKAGYKSNPGPRPW